MQQGEPRLSWKLGCLACSQKAFFQRHRVYTMPFHKLCKRGQVTTSEPHFTESKQENNGIMSLGVVRNIVSLLYSDRVVERKFPRLLGARCAHVTEAGQGEMCRRDVCNSCIIFSVKRKPLPSISTLVFFPQVTT